MLKVTVSEETRDILVMGFKVALIWQDEDFDGYDEADLSDGLVSDISDLVDSFISILNNEQKVGLIDDPSNFGHWLCLEQMGHGVGFYDSPYTIVQSVSDTLSENELYRPSDLYEDEGFYIVTSLSTEASKELNSL